MDCSHSTAHFGGRMWFGLEVDCVLWKQSLLLLSLFCVFLLVSPGFLAARRTQKSACGEACWGRFVPNMHSSRLLGTCTRAQMPEVKRQRKHKWYTSGHFGIEDYYQTKLLVVLSHCVVRYLGNKCHKDLCNFPPLSLWQRDRSTVVEVSRWLRGTQVRTVLHHLHIVQVSGHVQLRQTFTFGKSCVNSQVQIISLCCHVL